MHKGPGWQTRGIIPGRAIDSWSNLQTREGNWASRNIIQCKESEQSASPENTGIIFTFAATKSGPLVLCESSKTESEKIQKKKSKRNSRNLIQPVSQYAQHCVQSITIMSLSLLVLLPSFSLGVVTTPLSTAPAAQLQLSNT